MKTTRHGRVWGTAAAIVLAGGLVIGVQADHRSGRPTAGGIPAAPPAPATAGSPPAVDLHEAAIRLRDEATQLCWDVQRTAQGCDDFKRLYREAYEIYTIACTVERAHHRPPVLRVKLRHLNNELHEFHELSQRARTRSHVPASPAALSGNSISIWMSAWQRQLGWRVIDQRVDRLHEIVHAMLATLEARPAVPRRVTAVPPSPHQTHRVDPNTPFGRPMSHGPASGSHRPTETHEHSHHGPTLPGLTVRPQGRRIVIGNGRGLLFSFSLD